jgi:peptidoglycan/LPS O-acetylase OafA/YrhL
VATIVTVASEHDEQHRSTGEAHQDATARRETSVARGAAESPLSIPMLPSTSRARARATIAYQPALDGVRALAVVAVLLFHAEVPGFDGGYLGVSVFFTLSGYLITSLLVAEHDRTGRIDLARFYGRRVRRLLPASAACLAAVAIVAATTDVFAGAADLRRQLVGSILQVANWVFLAGEGSYQDLFQDAAGARSPLEHFWSLAIEEQFYWVWPPVMLVVLGAVRTRRCTRRGRGVDHCGVRGRRAGDRCDLGPRRRLLGDPGTHRGDLDRGRARRRLPRSRGGRTDSLRRSTRERHVPIGLHPVPTWFAPLAPAALATLVACVVLFPPSSGPAYEGWLPAVAAVSAALITGLQVDGPVRRVLSFPPLVWLGTISYGVYLYHWPIYVIADADRVGIDGAPLVVVQLALTLAVSVVSFYALERPVRHATWTGGPDHLRQRRGRHRCGRRAGAGDRSVRR